MSRPRHRPPWPLKWWPRRGESVAHAACREWDLPCGCDKCLPGGGESTGSNEIADRVRELCSRLGIGPRPMPFPPEGAPTPPLPWSETDRGDVA